jgi:exopolysaccharide biosynthesis polyprenyl glycosylphosphotransferase
LTSTQHAFRDSEILEPMGELSWSEPASNPIFPRLLAEVVVACLAIFGVLCIVNLDAVLENPQQMLLLRVSVRNVALAAIFLPLWVLSFDITGLYRLMAGEPLRREILVGLRGVTLGSLLFVAFLAFSRGGFPLTGAIYFFGLSFVLWVASRCLIRFTWFWLRLPLRERQILIVGTGPPAQRLYRELLQTNGLRCVGFVDNRTPTASGYSAAAPFLGDLSALEDILANHVVDEVWIGLPIKSCYAVAQRAIDDCQRLGVEVKYSTSLFSFRSDNRPYHRSEAVSLAALAVAPGGWRWESKRAFDVVGGVLGITLLLPFLLLISAVIKISSPGPAIFVQPRLGYNRRRFLMYKFRTMVDDAEALQERLEDRNEAHGPVFKIRDDPRVTPIGRWLRRTSLDELPQLVNVVRGDMSLVGPRPLPLRDVQRFGAYSAMRRCSVRPGMTGLWQVSGRSDVDFDRWIALDLMYIDRWSLSLDATILLRTLPTVFRREGAY